MKNIKKFIFTVIVMLAFSMGVNAASGSINASTSTKTAAVGSTFTVTVKVNCSEALGSWQFGISYDSTYISLQPGSSDTNIAAYGDGSTKSKTYTYKFKAIKSGNASVRVSSPSMVTWNDVNTLFTPSSSNASVTIKTQAEIQASYSKDNNLKSLTVEGYELSPAFDKDTLAYTVSVPDTVEQIKVSAQVNDGTARVSGTGEINISEGVNKVEVTVTAQNGSVKTYTITVDVKDLNPITVSINDKNYSVVKKTELLTEPVGFTPTTIKIGEVEVPAFTSELAKLTVLGLKDEEGNIGMYIYDVDSNKYTLYNEIKGTSITLYPVEVESSIKGFIKTTLTVDGKEIEVLENEKVEDFYLIYAMNVATGEEDYYIFDVDDNSFVRYNPLIFEKLETENKDFKIFTIALGCLSVVLFLLTALLAGKNSKFKRIIKKLSSQFEEYKNQTKIESSKKDENEDKPKKKSKKIHDEEAE